MDRREDEGRADAGRIRERHRDAAAEALDGRTESHYVCGEWVASDGGGIVDTVDPTTGEVIAHVQAGTARDVDRAVAAAREAFRERWGGAAPVERQRLLSAVADRIAASAELFATLETLDNGKPITEARADVEQVVDEFRYFAGAARTHAGSSRALGRDRQFEVVREPYGVVGGIVPWNYPLKMATLTLAPALAAGNAVVLKPAEQTPLSVLRLMREVDDVVPDGVVNVVTGRGDDAGAALAGHPGVDKVGFVGSTAVGREVMRAAADHVTDVVLELGGKNPIVVFEDADLDAAVDVAVDGVFHNTGECCTAGTRLFLHDGVADTFLDRFLERTASLRVGDPLDEATDLGPKVSGAQVRRTLDYVEQLRAGAGEVVVGGGRPDVPALADGCFVEPTVATGVDHDSPPAQEEIFGPVALVFRWSEYESMIDRVNDVDYGLAAGVMTADHGTARRAAREIDAGNVFINHYNEFPPGQPSGGFKHSGIGNGTVAEYTRQKTINADVD